MTAHHNTELGQAVHQAAAILSSLEYINQAEARSFGPLAKAVANAFIVVYYQAETGRATKEDFKEAMDGLKQALPVTAEGSYGPL